MENQENTRNFCIISHIDHGKSTLADRFLELTEAVSKKKMRPQYLDLMDLERERGITIKMQPVRMIYTLNTKRYTLNLIDTPGHIDFSYEVSRSLAAVEGAILLVDASKGIQAQTIHNLELAKKQNLVIIPAINKIDLPQARVEEVKTEVSQILNINKQEILSISAKNGTNIEKLLMAVIEKIPKPTGSDNSPFKAVIFDSKYDSFKGIIAYVRVFDGKIKKEEQIYLIREKLRTETKEVGCFKPELTPGLELGAGEIGYLATGVKEAGKIRVGDTIIKLKSKNQKLKTEDIEPLPGYREPKPMIFASLYPENADDFDILKEGLNKLRLSDPSFTFEQDAKEMLGRGYLCGFLGSLHAEIVVERLQREFGLNLIISHPSVVYKIINKQEKEMSISSPANWPDPSLIQSIKEPWVKMEIIVPQNYFGQTVEVLEKIQGKYIENKFLGKGRVFLTYEAPLAGIIQDFYDKLKGATQGFASMNYEILGYRQADLIKLEILIAGKKEGAFSKIVPQKNAYSEGRKIVKKLKEILPPQQFSVSLQAVISGKIIARETLRTRRKDVLAPLYGGDYTRKKKLLERQKRGKKKLKERSLSVKIPPKVFLEIFKSS